MPSFFVSNTIDLFQILHFCEDLNLIFETCIYFFVWFCLYRWIKFHIRFLSIYFLRIHFQCFQYLNSNCFQQIYFYWGFYSVRLELSKCCLHPPRLFNCLYLQVLNLNLLFDLFWLGLYLYFVFKNLCFLKSMLLPYNG